MKKLSKYLKIAVYLNCAIIIIYNTDGSPNYDAINEQFTESYEH